VTEKFKAKVIYLFPILASLMFGLLCASVILRTPAFIPSVTPVPETNPGGGTNPMAPYLNAVYFVVLVAIGASLIYILMRRKNRKTITYLIGFALSAAFLLVSIVYYSVIFASFPDSDFLVLGLAILTAVLGDFAVFKLGGNAANIIVLALGGALGIFLGSAIPVYSAVIILLFLAVYDIFTVYYGPVGKIAAGGLNELRGLSFSFKEIEMGLGDLVFYSLLCGNILFSFGIIPCFASLVGVLVGSFITFLMLERRGMFPGLPFPIAIGLACGVLTSLFI
jgi:presenilin-like A22 family membrane protease